MTSQKTSSDITGPTDYTRLINSGSVAPAGTAANAGVKRRRPSNAGSGGYAGHVKGGAHTYPNNNRKSGPVWYQAILYRISSRIQRWCLQHPNFFTKIILWIVYLFEALEAAKAESQKPGEGGPYVCWQRAKVLGPSFCVFGQVLTGELSKVKEWILEPQQRAATIAWIRMVKDRFPHEMLLFMSDKEAGGDGIRERVKLLFLNEIFGKEGLKQRASDDFTKQLLSEFAAKAAKENRAYNDKDVLKEREAFALTYINYVVLGVKLSPAQVLAASTYRTTYTGSRLFPFGYKRTVDLNDNEKEMVDIWSNAPALKDIDFGKYNLTKEQVVRALQPTFGVAAMPAINNFVNYILNFTPPDAQLDFKDKADFGHQFTLEMLRLHTPVATVNIVKQEPFLLKMNGKMERFPAGTTVGLNMWLSMHDANTFVDPFSFDWSRPSLTSETTSFHSVGDKNYGRMCPARKTMENFSGDFIEALKTAGWKPNNKPEWLH